MASDLPGVRDWVAAAGLVSFPMSAQFVGCQGPESQTDGGLLQRLLCTCQVARPDLGVRMHASLESALGQHHISKVVPG